jgi:polyphosphate kinase 2 (PPK2 family)
VSADAGPRTAPPPRPLLDMLCVYAEVTLKKERVVKSRKVGSTKDGVDVNRSQLYPSYSHINQPVHTMQAESSTAQEKQRGLFVVLEGLDRCGKSTQVDRLVAHLKRNGRQARLQKFPGKADNPSPLGRTVLTT